MSLTKILCFFAASFAVVLALGALLGADCAIVGLVAVLTLAALLKSILDSEGPAPPR